MSFCLILNTAQRWKFFDMESNKNSWKDVAVRLSKCLDRFVLDCHELHHNKDEYHNDNEPCPVVTEILKVGEEFQSLLKYD
jgi:hypothetical protein